ncbi:hypothetical protein EMIHUDRAFT_234785 [Emiliania huxleyi CCMP1516]|uniref:Uncharacterized protein n=2 Tax=Emiliania huxleyi TaxID=2903 RepID=A0A0D3JYQ8_EMIH1|nr:hypothetical protein EMIHUDRAFT_234785 [Emiliania huxleyi CCMP1516]EOD28643.1 hypothetical protein EMIHUDRAFT_234785 [Emiliania huxleyi CCMP1516]|eukprot:XP_005781072.1 hypothetical protein EMIHUDRAFT_234785 [Emiliania huxleyi CCMP1516]
MPLRRVALLFDVIVPDPNVALHPAKLIAEVEKLTSPRRDRLGAKAVPSVMRRFSERVLSLSPLKLGSGSGRRGVARQYTPRSSKASAIVRRSALVPTQRLPRVPPEEAIHYPSPIGARSRSRDSNDGLSTPTLTTHRSHQASFPGRTGIFLRPFEADAPVVVTAHASQAPRGDGAS